MTWFFSPLPQRSYRIVCIDVPWRWKNYSAANNWRSPEAKYPTMTMEQAARLPVRDLLAPRAFVMIWMTWPLIAVQSQIVENAWGLSIRTGGVWAKRTVNGHLRMGTGLIMRGVCEPFVIASADRQGGLRGRSERNLIETFEDAAIDGLAREHSRKPDEVYAMIERMTPGWRRADVFAREHRAGWDGFGDQLPPVANGDSTKRGSATRITGGRRLKQCPTTEPKSRSTRTTRAF